MIHTYLYYNPLCMGMKKIKKHRLEEFTDVEMIYYFVHRQKHVDKKRNVIGDDCKRLCTRSLSIL
ncbi:hypothetical protein GCM10020331_009840 [Ectobacillus funiculus]